MDSSIYTTSRLCSNLRQELQRQVRFLIVDDQSWPDRRRRFFARGNARACQEPQRRAIVPGGVPVMVYAGQRCSVRQRLVGPDVRRARRAPRALQALLARGRGKHERANRYIREAFPAEATHVGLGPSTSSTTASVRGPTASPTDSSRTARAHGLMTAGRELPEAH